MSKTKSARSCALRINAGLAFSRNPGDSLQPIGYMLSIKSMRTNGFDRVAFGAMSVSLSVAIGFSIAINAAGAIPDFSGQWMIVPASSGGSTPGGRGDMGSGWGSPLTITQDSNLLTVEYAFFGRGDMQPPLRFVYALDGSETKNSIMMGRGVQVQASKTSWKGDKLVITTIHTFANPASGKLMTEEVKQTLSVASPASLVVETTRAGVLGGPSLTTRTIYTKS